MTTNPDFSDPILGFRPVFRRFADPTAIVWHVYRRDGSTAGRIVRLTGYDSRRAAEQTARNCREAAPRHTETWVVPFLVTVDPPERFEDEAGLHAHVEARGNHAYHRTAGAAPQLSAAPTSPHDGLDGG